jgi:hypothetical protein
MACNLEEAIVVATFAHFLNQLRFGFAVSPIERREIENWWGGRDTHCDYTDGRGAWFVIPFEQLISLEYISQ